MKDHVGMVMTVNGPIEPEALGATLTHEHLYLPMTTPVNQVPMQDPEGLAQFEAPLTLDNLYFASHTHYAVKDNCNIGTKPEDFDLIVRELLLFKKRGGRSVVALQGTGSEDLLRFSQATGLNIITSTGYLRGAAASPTFKSMTAEFAKESSVEQIADKFLHDIRFGADDNGVLPGIIGELHTGLCLEPHEVKVLRAAAIAQKESGLAVTIHLTHTVRYAHDVLDILEEEGVPLNRVIIGHIGSSLTQPDLNFHDACDYMVSVADRGAYIEFDLCGNEGCFVKHKSKYHMPSDRERVKAIQNLVLRGHANRILTSQDVGHRNYLVSYGGWGYGHVLYGFTDLLREAGVREDIIHKFNHENPARVLTIR